MSEKLNQALSNLVDVIKLNSGSHSLTSATDHIEFSAAGRKDNYGRGFTWTGQGTDKQFVFAQGEKFLSTESIDLSKHKSYFINAQPVISEKELGPTITKSNLREVGKLKNLSVDGNVVINEYLFYNSVSDRLGLGTDEPNAALSIAEEGIEIVIGTENSVKAKIGTYGNHELNIVTDNIARITIDRAGDIALGNKKAGSVKVSVNGKMYVGQGSMDTRVDLHVDGAIKFNEKIHQYANKIPESGDYNRGDVIWNTDPELGGYVGWICVRSGTPGTWLPFGEIKSK